MVDNTQDLERFLTRLGLTKRHARIYLTLIEKGPLTALEIAQKSGIPRTTVYRELEDLQAQNIVTELVEEHSTRYQAASPDRLRRLLDAKQAALSRLTQDFPLIHQHLTQLIHRRQPDTEVRFYRGRSGIRQMVTNIIEASPAEIVGYTHTDFSEAVGQEFMEEFYLDMLNADIKLRDIFSDSYIKSMGSVTEATGPQLNHPKWDQLVQSRYLPKDKLDITLQMDIYANTVTFYNWHQGEVFGVEIINPKAARLQRQLFELIWAQATPEKELVNA